MDLKKKEVFLGKGKPVTLVSESGWDYTFRFSEIEKTFQKMFEQEGYDKLFKFFCENYYSLMAACSSGYVPEPEEAFSLPRLYLDNWYLTVWEMNEEIIGKPYLKSLEHEEVVFRDRSSVFVWAANGMPSFILRLAELEFYAEEHPFEDDPKGQVFQSSFYPKMAACCNGSDPPEAAEVRSWPRSEIYKWMEASRRLNPDWYITVEKKAEEAEVKKQKKTKKRSRG